MNGDSPKWFEFNDDNVTPFSPNDIPSRCFGGVNIETHVKDGKVRERKEKRKEKDARNGKEAKGKP